ncbi:MAG TPA: F0F1 ATP synthase subunit epsilon [Halanaerobiales bacterium]|nr:F0F1 ATP synthase subunit epsilon [Halanaerobiales bacterium]
MAPEKKILLEIITPKETVYKEEVDGVEAPAVDGLIGILPRHAPLITALKTGVIRAKIDNKERFISVSEGIMDVKPDQVNIVARTAELPEEIDLERAKKAKERAQERLEEESSKIDHYRAEGALERAIARIKAAEKHHSEYY